MRFKFLLILTILLTWVNKGMAKEIVYFIDAGFNFESTELKRYFCKNGYYSLVDNARPYIDHGQRMTKIATNNLNPFKVCVVFFNVYDIKLQTMPISAIRDALTTMITMTPGYVNMSLYDTSPDSIEELLIKRLIRKGFKFQIAAGNDGHDLNKNCNAYPACYFTGKENHVKIVSNNGGVSNKNGPVNTIDHKYWRGTSESTANITNSLLKEVTSENQQPNQCVRPESLWWIQSSTRSSNCTYNRGSIRTSENR